MEEGSRFESITTTDRTNFHRSDLNAAGHSSDRRTSAEEREKRRKEGKRA